MIMRYLKIFFHWFFRRKKTYSQLGEDRIVEFYLPQSEKGVYIDVGANDPIYTSNTYLFYKKGWRGICIEPDKVKCKIFKLIRPRDTVINIGIGNENSNLKFFVFDPDTLSTFSEEESKKYQAQGYSVVKTESIPVKTLKEIISSHLPGKEIDLLSVDAEGFDMKILQGNDWQRFRPKMVIVEVLEHGREVGFSKEKYFNDFMKLQDYVKFASTHLNNIYVDASYARKKGLL